MISRSAEHEAKRKRCAEERRKCIEERTQKILPHIERLYNVRPLAARICNHMSGNDNRTQTTLSTLRPLVQFSASLENLNIFKKVIWSARGTPFLCASNFISSLVRHLGTVSILQVLSLSLSLVSCTYVVRARMHVRILGSPEKRIFREAGMEA
jgi:hypothetical protein